MEILCITCPLGCRIAVEEDKFSKTGYSFVGNICKRGETYVVNELTNPVRVITSTIKIKGGTLNRLPIKTKNPIPKHLNYEAMKKINEIEVEAPVKMGDVVIANILDTGVDIVATRSMDKL